MRRILSTVVSHWLVERFFGHMTPVNKRGVTESIYVLFFQTAVSKYEATKQKRKFSSFFKSLVIELDKDLYGPDNHLVEVCRLGFHWLA